MICPACKLTISEEDEICPYCGEFNPQFHKQQMIEEEKVDQKINRKRYFLGAFFQMFKNYANFWGTTSRGEYWSCQLIIIICLIPFFGIVVTAGIEEMAFTLTQEIILVATGVFMIISYVPMLALNVRRLHDANFSGLLYFVNFLPGFGSLIYLFLTLMPYAENPYESN